MFKRLKGKSSKTKSKESETASAVQPVAAKPMATASNVSRQELSGKSTGKSADSVMEENKSIAVNVHAFSDAEKQSLKNTVLYPDTPYPYGDGSDKLFGIENYGYICYMSSIFQCLYHTTEFRKAVLRLDGGDENGVVRPRKYIVPGVKGDKITKSIPCNGTNTGGSPNGSGSKCLGTPPTTSSSTTSLAGSKKLSLFSRSNDSNHTDISASGNDEYSSYKNSDFGTNRLYQDHALREKYIDEFPALKGIDCNYFLNTQRNVTLVGLVSDPNATLEWRKKAALINGPIINLDKSLAADYGYESDNMLTVLKAAFECITENYSKTGVLSPYRLLEVTKRENIMFRNMQHQDAHEFFNFLINNVIESANILNKGGVISEIFEGELTSETKCLTCDSSSYRNEKFLDLSVDLEQDSSITNCLKLFSKIEMLDGNNKFYCENCYSYQEAAKTIKLRKLPKILAFHLKRFKYSESLEKMVKLFYRVEYVKTLRIANTTKDSDQRDKLYELYGVVLHIGAGPYHGHYVSLVKTELYGWLLFDDETVEKISEDYVYGFFGDGIGLSTAYVLFYQEVANEDKYFEDKLGTMLGNPIVPTEMVDEVVSVDLADQPRKNSIFGFMKK